MSKIKIGADELILNMRKNNHLSKVPNNIIGRRLSKFIKDKRIDGALLDQNVRAPWGIKDGSVSKFKLPKTAAQYDVPTDKLEELYKELPNLS